VSEACYLGTDVGGTFTDLVFYTASGEVHCFKVPSTPARPGASILEGIDEIKRTLGLGETAWRDMAHTHSSTVATNALIERKGARVGMIVTRGFRDLFELQRLAIPHPMRFDSRRPLPLIPRALVREVGGRVAADGGEIDPLPEADAVAAAQELVAAGAEIAIVVLLHSYRNPAHERAVREIIERHGIPLRVELSSEVWAQAREYERGVLTAVNASIRPIVEGYVERLDRGLVERTIATPARVARSNGGAELAETMRQRPVVALLSGPAAGVAGAAAAAADAGWERADLMTLDVGGTSADIGVIRGGRPVLSSEEHIADFPLLILEGWAEKRRRRSGPGLLWHLGFTHPGIDRCVFGRGAARAGTAARRQITVADGAGTRRARYIGGTARHVGRRGGGWRDPRRQCADGGGSIECAGAPRRRCAAIPYGGVWRRRAARRRVAG
jgi:N-methylhydantoinase A